MRPRWLCRGLQVTLAFLILAIGASRVYLGLHWPNDVMGGFALGGVDPIGLLWLRDRFACSDRL